MDDVDADPSHRHTAPVEARFSKSDAAARILASSSPGTVANTLLGNLQSRQYEEAGASGPPVIQNLPVGPTGVIGLLKLYDTLWLILFSALI